MFHWTVFVVILLASPSDGFSNGRLLTEGNLTLRRMYCHRPITRRAPLHLETGCDGLCEPMSDGHQHFVMDVRLNESTYWNDGINVTLKARESSDFHVTGFTLYAITDAGDVVGSFDETDDVADGTCRGVLRNFMEGKFAVHTKARRGRRQITVTWRPDGYNHNNIKFFAWIVHDHSHVFYLESQKLSSLKNGDNVLDIDAIFRDLIGSVQATLTQFEKGFTSRQALGYNIDLDDPFAPFNAQPSTSHLLPGLRSPGHDRRRNRGIAFWRSGGDDFPRNRVEFVRKTNFMKSGDGDNAVGKSQRGGQSLFISALKPSGEEQDSMNELAKDGFGKFIEHKEDKPEIKRIKENVIKDIEPVNKAKGHVQNETDVNVDISMTEISTRPFIKSTFSSNKNNPHLDDIDETRSNITDKESFEEMIPPFNVVTGPSDEKTEVAKDGLDASSQLAGESTTPEPETTTKPLPSSTVLNDSPRKDTLSIDAVGLAAVLMKISDTGVVGVNDTDRDHATINSTKVPNDVRKSTPMAQLDESLANSLNITDNSQANSTEENGGMVTSGQEEIILSLENKTTPIHEGSGITPIKPDHTTATATVKGKEGELDINIAAVNERVKRQSDKPDTPSSRLPFISTRPQEPSSAGPGNRNMMSNENGPRPMGSPMMNPMGGSMPPRSNMGMGPQGNMQMPPQGNMEAFPQNNRGMPPQGNMAMRQQGSMGMPQMSMGNGRMPTSGNSFMQNGGNNNPMMGGSFNPRQQGQPQFGGAPMMGQQQRQPFGQRTGFPPPGAGNQGQGAGSAAERSHSAPFPIQGGAQPSSSGSPFRGPGSGGFDTPPSSFPPRGPSGSPMGSNGQSPFDAQNNMNSFGVPSMQSQFGQQPMGPSGFPGSQQMNFGQQRNPMMGSNPMMGGNPMRGGNPMTGSNPMKGGNSMRGGNAMMGGGPMFNQQSNQFGSQFGNQQRMMSGQFGMQGRPMMNNMMQGMSNRFGSSGFGNGQGMGFGMNPFSNSMTSNSNSRFGLSGNGMMNPFSSMKSSMNPFMRSNANRGSMSGGMSSMGFGGMGFPGMMSRGMPSMMGGMPSMMGMGGMRGLGSGLRGFGGMSSGGFPSANMAGGSRMRG